MILTRVQAQERARIRHLARILRNPLLILTASYMLPPAETRIGVARAGPVLRSRRLLSSASDIPPSSGADTVRSSAACILQSAPGSAAPSSPLVRDLPIFLQAAYNSLLRTGRTQAVGTLLQVGGDR